MGPFPEISQWPLNKPMPAKRDVIRSISMYVVFFDEQVLAKISRKLITFTDLRIEASSGNLANIRNRYKAALLGLAPCATRYLCCWVG